MNAIDRLRAMGIRVTWGTLRAGFEMDGDGQRSVTGRDVLSFAESRASAMSSLSPDLIDLLGTNPYDEEDIAVLLESLSRSESDGLDRESRKWRLLLVEDGVDALPPDPVHALVSLTELWGRLGFPSDSPHVVQGRGNTIDPREYYTAATLDDMIARHRRWLAEERAALGSPEKKDPAGTSDAV